MNTTANRERFRQTMRYRHRLLANQRTHYFTRAAIEIRKNGKPQRRTTRKIGNIERQIREFNSLAEEMGIQMIRT
jgi:hypothetical protein